MTDQALEQRARELLAAEYEREGLDCSASKIRLGRVNTMDEPAAIRAIIAALRTSAAEGWPAITVPLKLLRADLQASAVSDGPLELRAICIDARNRITEILKAIPQPPAAEGEAKGGEK